jgi:dihydrofolate reductase
MYNHLVVDYAIGIRSVSDKRSYEKMKLTTTTWVSVDGVMQGLGAADEDPRGGFERGGWAMPHADREVETALNDVYRRADAFLFGRWTFEVFAGSWGAMEDMRQHPIGQALNTRPKYVASTSLTDPEWADTTVISGDLAGAVEELKAKREGELQVHGGYTMIRSLLANDLVDEINLFVAPVVLGQGARLFPETGPDIALELAESRVMSNGVVVQVYRPNGRPQYGPTTDTTPSWSK